MKQNNCVDIYKDYFNYEDEATSEKEDELKIIAEYNDPVCLNIAVAGEDDTWSVRNTVKRAYFVAGSMPSFG